MLEKCYFSMVMGNKGISQKVISKMAKSYIETFVNYFRDLLKKVSCFQNLCKKGHKRSIAPFVGGV